MLMPVPLPLVLKKEYQNNRYFLHWIHSLEQRVREVFRLQASWYVYAIMSMLSYF
jgi:hypothetical protein